MGFWNEFSTDTDVTEPQSPDEIASYQQEREQRTAHVFGQMKHDDKAARRRDRVNRCGREYTGHLSVLTGRPVYIKRVCSHMECDRCRAEEAKKERKRFERALQFNTDVWFFEIAEVGSTSKTREQINRLVKSGGGEIRWLPTENGLFGYTNADPVVLGGRDNFSHTQRYSSIDVENAADNHNWNELCKLPQGKRKSGDLGMSARIPSSEPEDLDENALVVKTPEFVLTGISAVKARIALRKTLRLTRGLSPVVNGTVTEISIKKALWARLNALTTQIIEQGGELTVIRWAKVTVRINHIDWSYTDNLDADVAKSFPTGAFEQHERAKQLEDNPFLVPQA